MVYLKTTYNSYPSNYRPISLISCVGKVMERVVYKHVYNHLESLKLILNALVKIQTEIHISALSFRDDYKRVYTLLVP
jgi:hypothetical protein